VLLAWSCGAKCKANADFITVASGGNGGKVQSWYVGYSKAQNTVVVGHQGTNTSDSDSVATDLKVSLVSLDSKLFPGIGSTIKVHEGFAGAQAKTATEVLNAVNKAISTHKTKAVTIVGHSLGGAIALLDSVYLPLHIKGVTFKTITYGMPRVGNQAFANYVDSHIKLTHINNKKDPIPILPSTSTGYYHPAGEVHIEQSGTWASCPGQDNPSIRCIVGAVPNFFAGETSDHTGPYDGVNMGC